MPVINLWAATGPLMEKEDDHRQTVDVLRSTGGN